MIALYLIAGIMFYFLFGHITYRVWEVSAKGLIREQYKGKVPPMGDEHGDTKWDNSGAVMGSIVWPLVWAFWTVVFLLFVLPREISRWLISDSEKVRAAPEPIKIPENYHCKCCPQRAHEPEDVALGGTFRAFRGKTA